MHMVNAVGNLVDTKSCIFTGVKLPPLTPLGPYNAELF